MKPMNDSDKPWEVISSEYLHRAPWLTVRKDHLVLPNGNHIPSYYILEYPDWVNTIAVTSDGQFVFIRQYRHGLQQTSYELCAGVCEKEDASPLASAQRELLEETGYGNGSWQEYMQISPQPEYPYQHYVLLPSYRCGKDFGTAFGRYGKPQRTSAYACGSKGTAAKRRDKASVNGRSLVEIYSRKRIITGYNFTRTACGMYNRFSIRNNRKPFFL